MAVLSPSKHPLALAVLSLTLAGCVVQSPKPLDADTLARQSADDRSAARAGVAPITGALGIDEALARALKYNLDRRAKMMEEALALRQVDVTRFDMLPKLVEQAGYTSRDNERISESRNVETGALSPSQFISQQRDHLVNSLTISWNLLDLGVGYYNSRQQGDRALIAGERRRKAMHVLMQDVRTAFWRALSAQKLLERVRQTTTSAEAALADSRQTESERLRNPVDALRYQRQVLENLRLLEAISQELSAAQIDLASLINAPLGMPITLAEPAGTVDRRALEVPVEDMELQALQSNPDLREQHYNGRIARDETRKTLARLFPNLNLSYGVHYDTDQYLVNNGWREAGAQLSFNLFNLLTGPTQYRLAKAGVAVADQRRVAMQMAVLTQVHLAKLHYADALRQFDRADQIWDTDNRIAEHLRNRTESQAQSQLDLVANQTTAILSELRRYQALAQAQAADARLQATLGVEPAIGSVQDASLEALTRAVAVRADWHAPAVAP